MPVLVIDDDVELCRLLEEYLRGEGLELRSAHDGPAGLAAVDASVELVILDVMLPGFDGFELLRRLRERSRVPVLMLTARGEAEDRIRGLEGGADDYLAKPFQPRELAARVKAILRRTVKEQWPEPLELHGVRLDPQARAVTLDGAAVELTTLEFEILHALMDEAGKPVSRDELMQRLYGRDATPFDRSV
ncbi:MAG: response regulator transcription factor, partial [Bryobacter sp.]|nr:response regulator transcription factor [Bryobacter sp.]